MLRTEQPVAGWLFRAGIPCSAGAGGVGSIPANSDALNVPSFSRWRFEVNKIGKVLVVQEYHMLHGLLSGDNHMKSLNHVC
jgi:hypothetical protein